MSKSKKGANNHRYGVEVSEETRAKIGAKLKGKKQSEETIRKKAEAVRGSKIYINGSSVVTNAYTGNFDNIDTATTLRIGDISIAAVAYMHSVDF